jgi:hypothetical protein
MAFVKSILDYTTFNWSSYTPLGPQLNEFRTNLTNIFSHFLPTIVPFCAVIAYWFLSEPIFCSIRGICIGTDGYPVLDKEGKPVKTAKTSLDNFMKYVTIVHSFALCVYSGWTCYNVSSIMSTAYNGLTGKGLGTWEAFMVMSCDTDGALWQDANLGFWVSHFYLSKYWEFLDTWILYLTGKKPMLLQTYHHAGVVFIMWSFVVTRNTSCGMVITLLNSGIHTVMYAYYTLTALKWPSYQVEDVDKKTGLKTGKKITVEPVRKLDVFITTSQLTQFVCFIILTLPTYFYSATSGCTNPARQLGTLGGHVYVLILMRLFWEFFNDKYCKGSRVSGAYERESVSMKRRNNKDFHVYCSLALSNQSMAF